MKKATRDILSNFGAVQFRGHFPLAFALLAVASPATAQSAADAPIDSPMEPRSVIIADLKQLRLLKAELLQQNDDLGVASALVDQGTLDQLGRIAREQGSCAAYDFVSKVESKTEIDRGRDSARGTFDALKRQHDRNAAYLSAKLASDGPSAFARSTPITSQEIVDSVADVCSDCIEDSVRDLTRYHSRNEFADDANKHVADLEVALRKMIDSAGMTQSASVDRPLRKGTDQYSLRAIIKGANRGQHPDIVIIGGHLDSVNDHAGQTYAPGADDNASGSATVIEAFRVLLKAAKENPRKRDIEFFWYAAEERDSNDYNLKGSKSIAQEYRKQGRKVRAVMQLDMTMFPGDGANVIAFEKTATSKEMTDHLRHLNDLYVKATIVDSQCGYPCSDHASWTSAGYENVVFPVEASTGKRDKKIHSVGDLLDGRLKKEHAALFARLAVAFALDLSGPAQ